MEVSVECVAKAVVVCSRQQDANRLMLVLGESWRSRVQWCVRTIAIPMIVQLEAMSVMSGVRRSGWGVGEGRESLRYCSRSERLYLEAGDDGKQSTGSFPQR
jgi:hypothetical protein